jgi:hypothetical protein
MRLLLFVLLLSITACDQNSRSTRNTGSSYKPDGVKIKEVDEYVTSFFNKYQKDGSNIAIDYLFETNKSLISDDVKTKLKAVKNVYGEFTGVEKITQKSVGNSLVLISYLVKHEKQPIRFTFVYYKAKEHWSLYKFQLDEEALSELEDASKIFIIK